MALNGIQSLSGDQRYIAELERIITDLQRQVATLTAQTNARPR